MKFRLLLVILLLCGVLSCKKNDSTPSPNGKTTTTTTTTTTPPTSTSPSAPPATDAMDVAANLVSGSLAANSNGLLNIAVACTAAAQAKMNVDSVCGTNWASNLMISNPDGAAITYSYKSKYSYTINCNDTSKTDKYNVVSGLVYNGKFNNSNVLYNNSGTTLFTINGLSKASALYGLSGEYVSTGTFTSKLNTTFAGSSDIDIKISALTLSKAGATVAGGNASVTVTGTMPQRGQFNYTGSIVFNANNTAVLTLYSTVYLVNLTTGEDTKQ